MKTLYVSDLDGTLLRSDQRTSEYTNRVVNDLVARGVHFSYATARSYNTSHKVTAGMTAPFPIIIYNGAFVRDNATGQLLLTNFYEKEAAAPLIRDLTAHGISPIVYAYVDGIERFSYNADTVSGGARDFIDTRHGDSRDRPVTDMEALLEGDIFYVTCIDLPEKLEPVYRKYDPVFRCLYQKDIYSGDQWFEIMPRDTSKAAAAKKLKALLSCDRLVVFGDAVNDLDLFLIADEAYAVANAVPELKAAATGVIGGNDEDGVAKWLCENVGNAL